MHRQVEVLGLQVAPLVNESVLVCGMDQKLGVLLRRYDSIPKGDLVQGILWSLILSCHENKDLFRVPREERRKVGGDVQRHANLVVGVGLLLEPVDVEDLDGGGGGGGVEAVGEGGGQAHGGQYRQGERRHRVRAVPEGVHPRSPGLAAACLCLLLRGGAGESLAIVFFFVYQKFRRERTLRISKTAGGTLIAFRYSDLQHVTKNFSEKLGGGAFGSVFKGKLPDSTAIAVKRLDGFHQGEKQFRAEVSTIGTTQHVNLVRLLGFCSEGSRRLLVYEYMQKGSLEVQLFPGETTALSWAVRYQIALGTARGLNYLHEKCRDCIIHCDVKPDNILLDDSFVPKVSDFGLAKLLGRDFSRVLTTMRGTRGYLAPEWISGVPITAKADVFSYGMMLLEIISGRRNADHGEEGRSTFFPTLAASKLHEGDVQTLLDPRLKGDANPEELTRACKVACWCIQDDESTRPTTGQIIQILEGFLDVNMPPIPRSLRALGESPDVINFFSDLSSSQTSQTQNSTTTSQTHSATSGSSHFHSS